MTTIKSKRAVKPFRKVLAQRVRDNRAKLVVFGDSPKKKWFLGVQINDTVHVYSGRFLSQGAAIVKGQSKFGVDAVRFVVAKKKVA